jgi:hypothetical protein
MHRESSLCTWNEIMNKIKTDITQSIISSLDINQRIGSIFTDAIILDTQFNIISISNDILETTGYITSDVHRQPISFFSASYDLKAALKEQLLPGYFEQQTFDILCKNGDTIPYSIAGFYMGLITDINGLIVLKLKNLEEIQKVNKELADKTSELDDFIYASAHSLRGPLATLKGLINLMSVTKKQGDIDFLIKQMNVFADRLDDKLHQLIYVAESDKIPTSGPESVSIQSIFQGLSNSIQEASIDFPVNFSCPVEDRQQAVDKGEMVLSLLNNLVLFFCHQPKKEENSLVLDVLANSSATEIMIRSKSFLICDSLIKKIKDVNFGYAEILKFPELINYYAAKKIMNKLGGDVQFMLVAYDEVVILMTVPRDQQLSLF